MKEETFLLVDYRFERAKESLEEAVKHAHCSDYPRHHPFYQKVIIKTTIY